MRDDFIFYTNLVEGRGYEIDKIFVEGGCKGMYRFNKGEWKTGKVIYTDQLECQKATATAIYNKIKNK